MTRSALTALAAALLVCALAATSCFNGGGFNNSGVIAGGGRFQLLIEPARTSVDGTHFLVDTATGDLWRLDEARGGSDLWVRLSDAPSDVAELELAEVMGERRGEGEPSP